MDGSHEGEEAYIQIAADVCGDALRGRTGFGAFRHFEDLFRSSLKLALDSGFLVAGPPVPWFHGHPFHEDWLYEASRYGSGRRGVLQSLLGVPASYDPRPVWALFWALAKAEHEFLRRYVPFWSHEERLTGHLVSQIVERAEEFGVYWSALSSGITDRPECRLWYADTAAGRRERATGADLGVVVQGRFSGGAEFFKVARFQAKKLDRPGYLRVDLEQLEHLLLGENLGYYLLYHRLADGAWTLPPTVASAQGVKYGIEQQDRREKPPLERDWGQGEAYLQDSYGVYDLAMFLTFGLADPAAEAGVLCAEAHCAVSALMASGGPPPTRLLVVTLGSGTTEVDWRDLLHEWTSSNE